jgi:hypothetical protein
VASADKGDPLGQRNYPRKAGALSLEWRGARVDNPDNEYKQKNTVLAGGGLDFLGPGSKLCRASTEVRCGIENPGAGKQME